MTEREKEMMALVLQSYYLLKQQHETMKRMARDLLEGVRNEMADDSLLYQVADSLGIPKQGARFRSFSDDAKRDPFTVDGVYKYSREWVGELFRRKVQQGTRREIEEFIDHLIARLREFEAEAEMLPPTCD